MAWIDVLAVDELKAKGKLVVRRDGRQILLAHNGGEGCAAKVFACANRCPHEGYPLSEGLLSNGCVLTCNWHNWKFDLSTGATLVGGDRLPLYPARIEGERIWLDLTPPDPALRRGEILAGLRQALEDVDQSRLLRETARLCRLGADPLDALRCGLAFAAERLQFGTTHAIAAAPDWLRLAEEVAAEPQEKLAAWGEVLGHIADDALGGKIYPFPEGRQDWDEASFLAAVEGEDEAAAIAFLRGALGAGLAVEELLPALIEAALAHYADFGHSLIYTQKSAELARRLGPEAEAPLLLLLARSLVYSTREDLLPEFSAYGRSLAAWGEAAVPPPPLVPASLLMGASPKKAMATVAAWSAAHAPERIFAVLTQSAAWLLLHADESKINSAEGKIAGNVGWLDFTHTLTFAEAGLVAARLKPALWPAVLLQIACFIGRNGAYADVTLDVRPYEVADVDGFLAQQKRALLDHGRDRFIISAHLLKTLTAGGELILALPEAAPLLAASLNRLVQARMKGRHVLRAARQMWTLVEQE